MTQDIAALVERLGRLETGQVADVLAEGRAPPRSDGDGKLPGEPIRW